MARPGLEVIAVFDPVVRCTAIQAYLWTCGPEMLVRMAALAYWRERAFPRLVVGGVAVEVATWDVRHVGVDEMVYSVTRRRNLKFTSSVNSNELKILDSSK